MMIGIEDIGVDVDCIDFECFIFCIEFGMCWVYYNVLYILFGLVIEVVFG